MAPLRIAACLLLAAALTACGVASSSTGTASATAPVAKPLGAPPRFRIVGCHTGGGEFSSGPRVREVAIGFDDGPAPDTPQFVTMLERLHASATFFMIGEQIAAGYRATLMRELRNGDVLGDHTWTHPDLETAPNVRWELAAPQKRIRSLTGYTPCVFRPPYGDVDRSIVGVARSLGMATILWDVDPTDWALPGTAKIISRVLAQVRPGSIIISHDGGGYRGETLAAYPTIIRTLRARGYRIVTIPQLLGFRPVYRECAGAACDGLGVPGSELPADALVEGGPLAHYARR
jgi:peptidoglycan/xylan/chitin deacetylase (PgdA/CDA1 family)